MGQWCQFKHVHAREGPNVTASQRRTWSACSDTDQQKVIKAPFGFTPKRTIHLTLLENRVQMSGASVEGQSLKKTMAREQLMQSYISSRLSTKAASASTQRQNHNQE